MVPSRAFRPGPAAGCKSGLRTSLSGPRRSFVRASCALIAGDRILRPDYGSHSATWQLLPSQCKLLRHPVPNLVELHKGSKALHMHMGEDTQGKIELPSRHRTQLGHGAGAGRLLSSRDQHVNAQRAAKLPWQQGLAEAQASRRSAKQASWQTKQFWSASKEVCKCVNRVGSRGQQGAEGPTRWSEGCSGWGRCDREAR